jgi:transcriptional regulator EpsA
LSSTLAVAAPVILSAREQEYLLHAIEAALAVDNARQFFLWSQGPLQALLPHQVLVALHIDAEDGVLHVECQHSAVLDAAVRSRVADREHGLAVRLARHCRRHGHFPVLTDTTAADAASDTLAPFHGELRALGLANVLVHATARATAGASYFLVFGLPQRPHARHAYFLALLLPQLHLMLQHLVQWHTDARAVVLARPVSAREAEILHWVREGKSNDEIGQILGISGLTVKNHLQRLYRLLGVSNRTHAIARGAALRLFERPPQPLARAA